MYRNITWCCAQKVKLSIISKARGKIFGVFLCLISQYQIVTVSNDAKIEKQNLAYYTIRSIVKCIKFEGLFDSS